MKNPVHKGSLVLIAIIALSTVYSAYSIYMGLQVVPMSENLDYAWTIGFAALVSMWAVQDSKITGIPRLSSYGLLMLVLWPLMLLYHTVSSKGVEGIVYYLGFWALYSAPFFLGFAAYSYS